MLSKSCFCTLGVSGKNHLPVAGEGIRCSHEAAVGHRVSVRLEVPKELIDLLVLHLVVVAHRINLLGNLSA